MELSYGVFPYYQEEKSDERKYFFDALHKLMGKGWITEEDIVAYLSGPASGNYGTTFLEVNKVSTMLNELNKYILP